MTQLHPNLCFGMMFPRRKKPSANCQKEQLRVCLNYYSDGMVIFTYSPAGGGESGNRQSTVRVQI